MNNGLKMLLRAITYTGVLTLHWLHSYSLKIVPLYILRILKSSTNKQPSRNRWILFSWQLWIARKMCQKEIDRYWLILSNRCRKRKWFYFQNSPKYLDYLNLKIQQDYGGRGKWVIFIISNVSFNIWKKKPPKMKISTI